MRPPVLFDCVVYVTGAEANAGQDAALASKLRALGAEVSSRLANDVSHVVYRR